MQYRSQAVALAAAVLVSFVPSQPSRAVEDTIKVALIGPFSDPGNEDIQINQYVVDYVRAHNPPLGKNFELVTFDHKYQPSEALSALKQAINQGIPFVMNCGPSNIATTLLDEVVKNNDLNPEHPILYLNCGARAMQFTNEKCSFWHFRFSDNAQQLAYALVKALPNDVKRVYLLNQDYQWGHSADQYTKEFLGKFRPDIQVVGNEFVPLREVKDFSPQIAKIKQSGAQSVVTGNWGDDLNLLIEGGVKAGLQVRYDTLLGWLPGAVTAIGQNGVDRMVTVLDGTEDLPVDLGSKQADEFNIGFRKSHKSGLDPTTPVMFEMLARAINEAGSADPQKVAMKLEGMQEKDLVGNVETMRKEDHQLILPIYSAVLSKHVTHDVEGTGLGWKVLAKVPAEEVAMPTTCNMKRPGA